MMLNPTKADQEKLNDKQVNTVRNICDMLQDTCSQMQKSHRDLHVPISKIGKCIDKNFSSDFACVADTKLFQTAANRKLLNHAITEHFLRHGMSGIASELIREANLPIDNNETSKFDEIESILQALRKKNVYPALDWAVRNRERLHALHSPLELKIHRINIIELYRQGLEKQTEIIKYARDHLQHLDPIYNLEVQHLMGGIIYLKDGIENSRYKSFLDPIDYDEIEDLLVSNACALLDLSVKSPLSVAFEAGCLALPALLNINQILSNQGVQNVWQLRDELPVEIDLGRDLQFHSTISCPILKQQTTDRNPAMRLVCGHVISREALFKLSGNSNRLKCPYCPQELHVREALQIYFYK